MTKNIIIFLGFFLMGSCGSRKVSLRKIGETQEERLQQVETVKIDSSAQVKITQKAQLTEKTEDFEFITIKEYYESGVLKSERKEKRKGAKISNQKYQDENLQVVEKQEEEKTKSQETVKKVSRTKEKEGDREEAYGFYVALVGIVVAVGIMLKVFWKSVWNKGS